MKVPAAAEKPEGREWSEREAEEAAHEGGAERGPAPRPDATGSK